MTDEIDMPHSELRRLVTLAARGAGLSWGTAEEAGWAAEWLARRSLPAADWAALWLAGTLKGEGNPVETGLRLADRLASAEAAPVPEGLPEDLSAPGYLLPFLYLIAVRHGPVELAAGTGSAAVVEPDGRITFGPAWSHLASGWTVALARKPVRSRRPTVSVSVLECLDGLALRTTVPASEKSRREAGAATTDND